MLYKQILENYYARVSKNLRVLWFKTRQVSGQHISIMIVPHNKARIINLQMSILLICVITFGVLALVSLSFISVRRRNDMQLKVEHSHQKGQVSIQERNHYMQALEDIIVHKQTLTLSISDTLNMINEYRFIVDLDALEYQTRHLAQREVTREYQRLQNKNDDIISQEQTISFLKVNEDVIEYRTLKLNVSALLVILRNLYTLLHKTEVAYQNLPYAWPTDGGRITSHYGPRHSPFGGTREFHLGVDIAEQHGVPVYAVAQGKVQSIKYSGGYGKIIKLEHRYGYKTLYAHLSAIVVRNGQYVKKGQIIGRVGSTGRSTGPHVHFEVRMKDKHVNPFPFLTTIR